MMRLLSVGSMFALALAVSAQSPTSRQTTRNIADRDRPMAVDQKFVAAAFLGGKFEIELCQLALRQSNDPEVKKLAQIMIDAHTECNKELQHIAHTHNIAVAQSWDPIQTAILSKLRSERGEEFDECFLCNQVLGHEMAMICFRKEAQVGQVPEIKDFAKKALPKLRDHLQMARHACPYAQDSDVRESLKPNPKGGR